MRSPHDRPATSFDDVAAEDVLGEDLRASDKKITDGVLRDGLAETQLAETQAVLRGRSGAGTRARLQQVSLDMFTTRGRETSSR